MPAFKVYLNNKKFCIAGLNEDGVLSAHVSSVTRKDSRKQKRLLFHAGALKSSTHEHLVWHEAYPLRIGDKLSIEVVESARTDRPAIRKKPNAAADLRAKKRYVRMLAKELGWKIVLAK